MWLPEIYLTSLCIRSCICKMRWLYKVTLSCDSRCGELWPQSGTEYSRHDSTCIGAEDNLTVATILKVADGQEAEEETGHFKPAQACDLAEEQSKNSWCLCPSGPRGHRGGKKTVKRLPRKNTRGAGDNYTASFRSFLPAIKCRHRGFGLKVQSCPDPRRQQCSTGPHGHANCPLATYGVGGSKALRRNADSEPVLQRRRGMANGALRAHPGMSAHYSAKPKRTGIQTPRKNERGGS